APVTSVAGKTGAVTLVESDIGSLVADLALKAPLASPTFTGDPKAPTPSPGDDDTSIATTAFVTGAISTAVSTLAPAAVGINSQSGTIYTLVLGDSNTVVETTNSSAVTITVPPNSSVAFPVGIPVYFFQSGSGQITVSAGAGVTIRTAASLT